MNKDSAANNGGFTLIELLVAMAVFLILVSISTAIFIETLRAQRQITDITANNESASEALEQMARDIRTGYQFTLYDSQWNPLSDGEDAQALIFTSVQENNTVGYKLEGDSIARCVGTGQGTDGICMDDVDYSPITPVSTSAANPGVDINSMSFIGSNLQSGVPRVTILVSVVTPSSTQPVIDTYLQTTISARNF